MKPKIDRRCTAVLSEDDPVRLLRCQRTEWWHCWIGDHRFQGPNLHTTWTRAYQRSINTTPTHPEGP